MKKTLLLLLFVAYKSALASYDIILENNTPYPLDINTGVHEGDSNNIENGWHHQLLSPYQRANVQRFNYDHHIKAGHDYHFFITARKNQEHKQPLLSFETTVHGDMIGSHISFSKAIYNNQETVFFPSKPHPNPSILASKNIGSLFSDSKNVVIRADAIKYTVPNPHYNFQSTDAISYVISQKQTRPKASNKNEITVLTYNTQIWPAYAAVGGIILNKPTTRVKNIAKKLQHDDVITLQEFFDRDIRDSFSNLMLDSHPYHTTPAMDYHPLSSGVAIYSKWPIEKEDKMIFRHCTGIDCQASKGVSYAKINKLGQHYHIFSTHLQAVYGDNLASTKDERQTISQQVKEVSDFIKQQNIPLSEPVILTGDLNLDISKCHKQSDCDEKLLLEKLHANYIPHHNRNTLPFSDAPQKNWMNTGGGRGAMLDYILPIENYLPTKAYQANLLVLRGDSDAEMYTGTPYGNTDLSDHFALEAAIAY